MKPIKRQSDRSGRSKLRSPGRPRTARREDQQRFWALIAAGWSSERAATGAGISPAVGARWFREAGGMPTRTLSPRAAPLSGRFLSFVEREEIALYRAQQLGIREIARRLKRAASTISREVRRNAATRSGGLGLTPKLGHFRVETRFKDERTLSSSLFHPVVGMTAACAVSCPHMGTAGRPPASLAHSSGVR